MLCSFSAPLKLQHLPFFAENTIQNHADFSPRSIPKNGMARRNTTAEKRGIESLLSPLSRELGNGVFYSSRQLTCA